jgi:hypothetical protein
MLAQVKPVLDPLLVAPLRNAVVHSGRGRGKVALPPGIAKKLNDTTVVTSTAPVAPRFRPDLAKRMRVNNAPDHAKGQKFQVRDERKGRGGPPPQSAQAPAPVQQPQRQQPPQSRGQQKQAERRAQQQPQGERVAAPARHVERPPSAPRAKAQPQPKHERPPQVQQKQAQPDSKSKPPASHGGGKGKGKKP